MPEFKSPSTTVKRRFSDFLGLHERLASKHLHLGRVVPPAPEKSVLGERKHTIFKFYIIVQEYQREGLGYRS